MHTSRLVGVIITSGPLQDLQQKNTSYIWILHWFSEVSSEHLRSDHDIPEANGDSVDNLSEIV